MRDQYVGDVSDVLKFSLLRALAQDDQRVGIGWYYIPGHDGRMDGRHTEWRNQQHWRGLDKELCDGLLNLDERSVAALQELCKSWFYNSEYFGESMPNKAGREAWGIEKLKKLKQSTLIFLDPDNGVGKEGSKKHATMREVAALASDDRAVLFITFPHRQMTHIEQVNKLHERIQQETGCKCISTARICVSIRGAKSDRKVPRIRWFTLVNGDKEMEARLKSFGSNLSKLPDVKVDLN